MPQKSSIYDGAFQLGRVGVCVMSCRMLAGSSTLEPDIHVHSFLIVVLWSPALIPYGFTGRLYALILRCQTRIAHGAAEVPMQQATHMPCDDN